VYQKSIALARLAAQAEQIAAGFSLFLLTVSISKILF
jgi:hypothetical protein